MHFLAKISIPADAGNKFIVSKDFNQKMDELIAGLKPEASYFCIADGNRTIFALINMDNSSDIPRLVEPFWLTMNASVEFFPAMTQAEFSKAGPGLKQAVEKFGKPMTT